MFRKNGWTEKRLENKEEVFKFTEDYKKFLDLGKTEREVVEITEKEIGRAHV